jgi:hypothetical protein
MQRTLLNAILLGLALALLLVDSLNALVEVVLGGGALGRVLALYKNISRQQIESVEGKPNCRKTSPMHMSNGNASPRTTGDEGGVLRNLMRKKRTGQDK